MMGEILFLAHRVPFPPDRGDKIRSFHLLKTLAALAPVHLISFADDHNDAQYGADLEGIVSSSQIIVRARSRMAAGLAALARGKPASLAMFDDARLRRHVDTLLATGRIGTIFAFSGQMAQFVPPAAPSRFLMDFVDVDSAKFESYAADAGPLGRWVNGREARLLGGFEAEVAARADLSLFVSDAEAALFRARTGLGADRVTVLENGIDLDAFDPKGSFAPVSPNGSPLILFTGQMDYRPNVEAVCGFAERAFPAIRARHPRACFNIVGRHPDPAVIRLQGRPGIRVTGAVPDVRGWLAAADVVVAPLGIARGVQNKVLEAMAMARPVVASPAAFEGIVALPGEELVVAAPGEEATAILSLLADPDAAAAIGQAARRRVEARYSWAARLAPLAAMIDPARETAA